MPLMPKIRHYSDWITIETPFFSAEKLVSFTYKNALYKHSSYFVAENLNENGFFNFGDKAKGIGAAVGGITGALISVGGQAANKALNKLVDIRVEELTKKSDQNPAHILAGYYEYSSAAESTPIQGLLTGDIIFISDLERYVAD